MRFITLFFITIFAAAGPARAEWREASSDHFVVVADDSEKDLREFTEQLERYHGAMGFLFSRLEEQPSPSNRVTIYVVRNDREVRKLLGQGSDRVVGFYVPRAGGSAAFVPRIENRSRELDESMLTLLHEYAHHFLISSSAFPIPLWMSEGAAEFFASAKFEKDGGVSLGRPARHRAYELFNDQGLSAEDVLVATEGSTESSGEFGAFYGKSWLLYHYLTFSKERAGQLKKYGTALQSGKNLSESAIDAFGDLDQLERDITAYLRRRRMNVFNLSNEMLDIGPITIRDLTTGETDMVSVKIRSKRGVNREQALELLAEAREIAALYPADAAVQAARAEAEFDAGNNGEAIAAANAALAIDPGQVNAYVQKGYALFDEAESAINQQAAYAEAIKPFVALNKIENNHPLPLVYFYRSYAEQGETPSELAVRGLARAAQLAPFDLGLRYMLAIQDLRDGNRKLARTNLVPVAYNPHGGTFAETARIFLDRLDEGVYGEVLAREMADGPGQIADLE